MSFCKIYLHLVWSTKNRQSFLNSKEMRVKVWDHIKQNGIEKNIPILAVSGYIDHCHCLIKYDHHESLSEIVKLIKGESSHWINKNEICSTKFSWQSDFYAASVSEKDLNHIYSYFSNQEIHHKLKTYTEELAKFEKELV